MQNRILLVILMALSIIYLTVNSSSNTTIFSNGEEYIEEINVKNAKTNNIDRLLLEEYVVGVVAAEMPASFNEEALKAQAIASRTYAVYKMQNSNSDYDVITDVSNQRYITIEEMKDKWKDDFQKYYDKVLDAVNKTKGMVMLYNDKIVEAYYFAMSNGYTEDVSLVFSEKLDYLKSVESGYDKLQKNFKVTIEFSKEEVCNKLNINCSNLLFGNINRSNTGRVNTIYINEIEYRGTEIRKKLGLRSTDFTIEEKDNKIYITTKGYGHGVGMSQYGANGLALNGYNYEEILKYFYQNIKITTI